MNIKDRFLRFTYNGTNSEEYGIFYENKGEDISFPYQKNIDQKTISPLFQGREYWVGSDKKARSFTLNLAADRKSLPNTEEIFAWLDPSSPGKLRFDFRDNYEFDVIITSISDPTLIPIEEKNGLIEMILLFKVTFTTLNDHRANTTEKFVLKKNTADNTLIYEPDELLPIANKIGNKIHFYNWSNEPQNVEISLKGSSPRVSRSIFLSANNVYGYSSNDEIVSKIDIETGAIVSNGKLIEVTHPTVEIINKGPNPIKPGLVYQGYKDLLVSSGIITIPHDPRMKNVEGSTFMLAILPEIDKNTETMYLSKEKGDQYTGLYPSVSGAIIRPSVLTGTFTDTDSEFTFAGAGSIKEGKYRIKIVRVDFIEITGASEWTAIFNYRKEV